MDELSIENHSPISMDELSFGSLFMVAMATLALALALMVMGAHRRGGEKGATTGAKNLPPGPWNLPVIGSLHHLLGASPPHRALLRLSRRHGPLMLVRLGEVPTVIVSGSDAAMEVLKARDPAFADRARSTTVDAVSFGGKGVIFAPYGEHWRHARRVCLAELLSARQVRRLESIRQEEVSRLVDSIIAGSSNAAAVDMTRALAALTNDVIARAVFGGKCARQEEYRRELGVLTTLVAGYSMVDLFPSSRVVRWLSRRTERRLRRSHAEMARIVGSIIEERKEKKGSDAGVGAKDEDDDLLGVLLRLQEEDGLTSPLTAEVIAALVTDIFGAATDTTASTLEWIMVELMRNPRAMDKAQQEVRNTLGHEKGKLIGIDISELHYLCMVIKETLRLHPASALILRQSRENCRVMGYDIPQATPVLINTFAVARDPKYWDNAEEFKPERFENSGADIRTSIAHLGFIPFGAGCRQCPGALLATTTLELTLANLLYHFDWALPDGVSPKSLDMSEVMGITLHRRSSLHLHTTLTRSGFFSHSGR
uniref:Cytochrome P450 n=1 Tax=Oryza rufipogon TaxID=4529 RepID=A0A0E0ND22_ORYRU